MHRRARGVPWMLLLLVLVAVGCKKKDPDPSNSLEMKDKLWKSAKWALWKVDATDEQKARADRLLDGLAPDLFTYQQESKAIQARLMDALEADRVDPASLATLREEGTRLWDRYMARMARAVVDIADVLTPDQRRELVGMWRKYENGD